MSPISSKIVPPSACSNFPTSVHGPRERPS
jgi:hypothetical protein